jgi:stalled ribosome rescue protein Dom34
MCGVKFYPTNQNLINPHKGLLQWNKRRTMTKVKRKQSYKRGYPVALLIGFENANAVLWHIFSQVIKRHLTLKLEGKRTNEKALYNFHESLLGALKPTLKEGVKSIVIIAPPKTTYAEDFLDHIRKHHNYLIQSNNPNRATFAKLEGSADQPSKVAHLVKTKEFHEIIAETTSREADHVINVLEKHLNNIDSNRTVLFSLKEIEGTIYDPDKKDDLGMKYLLLTDQYLAEAQDKNRIHRLLQISNNKKIKTRIVKSETGAGKRISQLGGIVFFATTDK